jgi:hypothetical protein
MTAVHWKPLQLGTAWIGVTVTAVAAAWFGLRPAIEDPTGPDAGRPGFDSSYVVRTVGSPSASPSAKTLVAPVSPSPSSSPSPKPSPSRSQSPSPKPPPKPSPTQATTRTVNLAGGVVQLERRNGRVEVKDVSVRPGFGGRGWREPDGSIVIELQSNDHKSTLRAFVRDDCGLCADVQETST